jgi:ParB-like chromosome segregation protein Spo0J
MNPETIAGYRIHPAANLFPLMDEAELQALADDIKKNGQKEPVYLFNEDHYVSSGTPGDTWIVDGRNRALACERSGIKFQHEHILEDPYTEDSIVRSLGSVHRVTICR